MKRSARQQKMILKSLLHFYTMCVRAGYGWVACTIPAKPDRGASVRGRAQLASYRASPAVVRVGRRPTADLELELALPPIEPSMPYGHSRER